MLRRSTVALALLLTLPAAVACRSRGADGRSTASPAVSTLTFEERTLAKTIGNCTAPTGACASISIRYPEFTAAPTEAALTALNDFVRQTLLLPTFTDQPADSLDTRIQQFIADYQEFRAAYPDAPAEWRVDQQARVVFETPHLVSLAIADSSYTGGAHPNEQTIHASFDLDTGARLTLDTVLAVEGREAVRALAEQRFRGQRGLAPGQSLTEAGFHVEQGRLRLTPNFAVVGEGLLFYYNAYEVGPYALGPTKIVMPWSDLTPHLERDTPVAAIAAAGHLAAIPK